MGPARPPVLVYDMALSAGISIVIADRKAFVGNTMVSPEDAQSLRKESSSHWS